MAKSKRKDSLQRLLNFTDEDLEANRAGYMTERQQDWIRREIFFVHLSMPVGVLLGWVSCVWSINAIGVWLLLSALLIIILLFIRQCLQEWLRNTKVNRVAGKIALSKSSYRGREYCYVRIGQKQLTLPSGEVYSNLQDGENYAFYVGDSIPTILSVERLPD